MPKTKRFISSNVSSTDEIEKLKHAEAKGSGDVFYYRANDLAARYKVHVITIWKWVSNGNLPPPTRLGPNTRAWRSDLIERWEAQRSSPRSAEAGQ
jgi:predicted DNA-binding transcriptional regulator AlpA